MRAYDSMELQVNRLLARNIKEQQQIETLARQLVIEMCATPANPRKMDSILSEIRVRKVRVDANGDNMIAELDRGVRRAKA